MLQLLLPFGLRNFQPLVSLPLNNRRKPSASVSAADMILAALISAKIETASNVFFIMNTLLLSLWRGIAGLKSERPLDAAEDMFLIIFSLPDEFIVSQRSVEH